ncbi:MAG: type II toxin-antitoxin system prevent-host-death family antitoxin [Sphingomonadales bacterium]|nr:type II toxin-antitoxin system prevent-host-death family antitoxin [Sphingomonadales bacterium]
MIVRTITEAKAQLSRLVARALAGDEVVISRAGTPVARLVPYDFKRRVATPGALKGEIKTAKDFDELPEDITRALGIVHK